MLTSADAGADAVVPHGGDADDGPVLGPPVELLEVDQPAAARLGHADLGEQLVVGAAPISRKPVKKSSAAISRSPSGPWATSVAPSASTAAGRSEAGSPWASEPPIVPRWRTWGSPTCDGDVGRAAGSARRAARRSRRRGGGSARRWRRGRRRRGRRTGRRAGRCRRAPPGVARRSFISGSSEWPPASSLASSPCSVEQRDGLVGRAGPDVVERDGDHDASPGSVVVGVRTVVTRRRRPAARGQDGLDDVVVAGAAAEVALEAETHLALGRVSGSRRAATPRPSPCPACSSRTAGRGARGTPPASGAARRRRAPGPRSS